MKIIRYHNDINKLKIGNFTENETDIFFSLLLKAKETKDALVTVEFLELKKLSNGDKNNDRFIKNILGLNSKLKAMNQTIEIEKGVYLTFSLFGDILTDTNKKIVEVPINQRFRYMIDGLVGNFTRLDLKELVSLKGNYSKTLYRLLKQWESGKKFTVSIEAFRELMGVPEKYEMRNIDQKVLNPSLEELKQYFKSLKLKKIKKGVKVVALEFVWKAHKPSQADETIEPVKYKYGTPEEVIQYRNGSQKDIYEEIQDRESAADLQEITEDQEAAAVKILMEEGLGYIVTWKEKSPITYWNSIRSIIKKSGITD